MSSFASRSAGEAAGSNSVFNLTIMYHMVNVRFNKEYVAQFKDEFVTELVSKLCRNCELEEGEDR